MDESLQPLLDVTRKYAKHVVRGVISPQEYINKVFSMFLRVDRVYPEVVPELWSYVPDDARVEFNKALCDAIRPEYCYRAFFLGVGQPITEEEQQRNDAIATTKIQLWCKEFLIYLANVET